MLAKDKQVSSFDKIHLLALNKTRNILPMNKTFGFLSISAPNLLHTPKTPYTHVKVRGNTEIRTG